jgi:hypothetical protein
MTVRTMMICNTTLLRQIPNAIGMLLGAAQLTLYVLLLLRADASPQDRRAAGDRAS